MDCEIIIRPDDIGTLQTALARHAINMGAAQLDAATDMLRVAGGG